jgi:hypothetical protein
VNQLPIQLELAEVALIGVHEGETGTRWTLGPTWYDDHMYDEDLLPYYDNGDRNTELAPTPTLMDEVKTWAARMIAQTTDYRVIGWSGTVPDLERDDHVLEFWLMVAGQPAASHASYHVTGVEARAIIRSLGNPDDIIVITRHDHPTVATYIPVRGVATVNHMINQVPVKNI